MTWRWRIVRIICCLPIWWVFTVIANLLIKYGLSEAKPIMRGQIGQGLIFAGCWILAMIISDCWWPIKSE